MLSSIYKNNVESNNLVNRNITKPKKNNQLIVLIITLISILVIFTLEKTLLNIFEYNDLLKRTNTMLIKHGFSLKKIYIIGSLFLKSCMFAIEIMLPSSVISLFPNFVCRIAKGFFSLILISIVFGRLRLI